MFAQQYELAKTEFQQTLDELQTVIGDAAHSPTPLHVVEEKVWRLVLGLGRHAIAQLLAQLEPGDAGERVTLPDGKTVKRLKNLHSREYVSVFGPFTIARYVYGSREGQKIVCVPLDSHLSLPGHKFSFLLEDWDQMLATEHPFAKVSEFMERLLGLRQYVDSLEIMNRRMAKDVDAFRMSQSTPPADEEGEILVVTADGKGVPIRRPADSPKIVEHEKKPGPKPDRKKIAIVGAVYTIAPYVRTPKQIVEELFRDPQKRAKNVKNATKTGKNKKDEFARPRPCHKRVRACLTYEDERGETILGGPTIFGWMADEASARNKGGSKKIVCIMDGQKSLWEWECAFQGDQDVVEILDLLHVTPRLWEAAHIFHQPKSRQAKQFVRKRVRKVLCGQTKSVIQGLRRLSSTRKLRGKKLRSIAKICNYFETHAHRMRYDEYLARGYPIASGVIEGTCRHAVKDRLEETGMSWIIEGANSMLDLRTTSINDDWEEFVAFRIAREIERLYSDQPSLDDLNKICGDDENSRCQPPI